MLENHTKHTMKKNKLYLLVLLLAGCQFICAQKVADTALLIKEFNKVMSFTTNPYVYYTTVSVLNAEPVLQAQDTAILRGQFYKSSTEIYSNNNREEIFLQDSLMVQVNNDRKTIWLNKVDVASKAKMNIQPAGSRELQEILKRNYTISSTTGKNGLATILFETRKQEGSSSTTNTSIALQYDTKTSLPQKMTIDIHLKQPVDEEMLTSLKEQEVDEKKLVQEIEGVKYLVRRQTMEVTFMNISTDEKKIPEMPRYKSVIELDKEKNEYNGTGKYAAYEVTKLF